MEQILLIISVTFITVVFLLGFFIFIQDKIKQARLRKKTFNIQMKKLQDLQDKMKKPYPIDNLDTSEKEKIPGYVKSVTITQVELDSKDKETMSSSETYAPVKETLDKVVKDISEDKKVQTTEVKEDPADKIAPSDLTKNNEPYYTLVDKQDLIEFSGGIGKEYLEHYRQANGKHFLYALKSKKDIAKKLKVAPSTFYKYLKDGKVKETTKKKISEGLQKMHVDGVI